MTYDKIFPIRARSADQCGRGAHASNRLFCQSRRSPRRPLRNLPASGLPLCAAGTGGWFFGACAGTETCLHGETAPQLDRSHSAARCFLRTTSWRDRHAGPHGFSGREWGAWLTRRLAPERSSWNTSLTGYLPFASARRTACSSQTRFGARARESAGPIRASEAPSVEAAVIDARGSSERQREERTVGRQTVRNARLVARPATPEWRRHGRWFAYRPW